jgi:hypothetical protein
MQHLPTPKKKKKKKASATPVPAGTNSLASLDQDFILQIAATDLSQPRCVAAPDPVDADTYNLLVSLVLGPVFQFPLQESPAFVFLINRSTPMAGSRIDTVKSALRLFFSSLPQGVYFNICSFGNRALISIRAEPSVRCNDVNTSRHTTGGKTPRK